MNAEEFDKKFDDGLEDIIDDLDLSSRRRPNRDVKRVSVDLPLWMVDSLDTEAQRLAVTRQSVIKVWLSERIDQNWRALEAEDARRKSQTG
jgi:hypothetical protein